MILGSRTNNKEEASIKIFIRDLLRKEVIEEDDLIIIEDAQNTKHTTVRDFVRSIIKDDDVPTNYRIYSSKKIQEMIDEISGRVDIGVGQVQELIHRLDTKKADREELKALEDTLIAEIDKRADTTVIMEAIDKKMDKDHKFTADDFDISSDDKKIKLENLSDEVKQFMTGAIPIPSNRPPRGGWVTEDIADGAITFGKLDKSYRFGGHFIEGNINEFTKEGIYTLGSKVVGLPMEEEGDTNQVRLLTVEITDNNYIKQKVEYLNDLQYRPIYRRVCALNRLRVTDFIRVEEINDKFKAHRGTLSDDFNNCGELFSCDLFTITREGHYIADESVTNLPTRSTYEVDIRRFGDKVIYEAIKMGDNRCDIYQSMQYQTTGMNPVNTKWFNISNYSRSKFEGKTVHLFGDGIIFGLGSDDIPNASIPALLSIKYGMRIINNALGDATVGNYDDEILAERSVVTQVSLDTMEDADYVIIMAGTHDWDSSKADIGTTTSISDTTFKGSLNVCVRNILNKNASTKILLLSPFFRSRVKVGDNKNSDDYMRNDYWLNDFAIAMKEVAEYNHLPYIDLYGTSGINKFNSTAYLKDGLYLNDAGHELIADKIMNAMNMYY